MITKKNQSWKASRKPRAKSQKPKNFGCNLSRVGKLYDKTSAFGFTINGDTLGFQLFHVSTFFQLSAFYSRNSLALAFSSWLSARAFQLWLFLLSKIKKNRQKAWLYAFIIKTFFQLSAFSFLHPKFFDFRLLALGFRLAFQLYSLKTILSRQPWCCIVKFLVFNFLS